MLGVALNRSIAQAEQNSDEDSQGVASPLHFDDSYSVASGSPRLPESPGSPSTAPGGGFASPRLMMSSPPRSINRDTRSPSPTLSTLSENKPVQRRRESVTKSLGMLSYRIGNLPAANKRHVLQLLVAGLPTHRRQALYEAVSAGKRH